MVDIASLVIRADAYAKRAGWSPSRISKALFDDSRTLDLLRDGGEGITVRRLRNAFDKMDELEAGADA